MSPITHAILPLALGYYWIPKRAYRPTWSASVVIALSGALPDILDPHISLEARYNSWSHTLLACSAFGGLVMTPLCFGKLRRFLPIGILCVAGYALHLVCDLISGGGRPLIPFSRTLHGSDLVPSWSWGATDIVLLLWVYLCYRWIPLRKAYHERLRQRTPLVNPKQAD